MITVPKFLPGELPAPKPRTAHGAKPRALVLRERDIERYLVDRVKEMGGEVRKVKWIGRNGAPDRIVMLPWANPANPTEVRHLGPTQTIWVELKAPGKIAEPHQLREHERMRKMGQRVEVVDSFARVDEILS